MFRNDCAMLLAQLASLCLFQGLNDLNPCPFASKKGCNLCLVASQIPATTLDFRRICPSWRGFLLFFLKERLRNFIFGSLKCLEKSLSGLKRKRNKLKDQP